MGFNIDAFDQHIGRFGTQSPNKFEVDMTIPTLLAKGIESGGNDIIDTFIDQSNSMFRLRAEGVTLPGTSILTADTVPLGAGRHIKQAYNATFTDCRIEFLADAEGYLEAYFNMWLNTIFNFADSNISGVVPGFYANYREDVVSTINIYKYDDSGVIINTYTLMNAMPTAIYPVQMAWAQFNQRMKFIVNLHYTGYAID